MEINLNVVYQTDENYAVYTGVSLYSLLENNKSADSIDVYILDGGISEFNKEKLCKLASNYNRKLQLIDTAQLDTTLEKLGAPRYRGSYATYYKLFLPTLFSNSSETMPEAEKSGTLPQTEEGTMPQTEEGAMPQTEEPGHLENTSVQITGRILYIDGDTIVPSDITPLFEYDLEGKPLGMVEDTLAYKHKLTLGFDKDEVYFNAGVILFDTDAMRKGGFDEKLLHHITNECAEYVKHDQDLINVVFRNEICELPIRFNLQSIHAASSVRDFFKVYSDIARTAACMEANKDNNEESRIDSLKVSDESIFENERENAVICHFLRFNGQFAWNCKSIHPYAGLYRNYKCDSPWKDAEDPKSPKGMIFVIERLLYRVLPRAIFLRIFRWIHDRANLI